MKFRRILTAPLLASALLLANGSLYSISAVHADHHAQEEQPEKAPTFRYVCPMHEDVKSKKPGKCPKCKMKLEKKRIKEPVAKPSEQ